MLVPEALIECSCLMRESPCHAYSTSIAEAESFRMRLSQALMA
jgi:hypothetical protein